MAKAAKPAAKGGSKKKMTMSGFLTLLSESSGHKKAEVSALYDKIVETVAAQLKANGEFILPGVAKLKIKQVPADPGGKEKIMPATGLKYTTKPKKASKKVKAFAVKALKDAVN